ncbi:MAG: hypothetical protein H6635_09695 [Anaerolineales bacterium]|nr:hypothetical protein [Anaerolineales bacterium]MCB9145631.1 hypothetical protein [Anaerolineales bacterium]
MFNLFKKKEQKVENPATPLRSVYAGNSQLNEWPNGDDNSVQPWSLFIEARSKLKNKQFKEAEKVYRQILSMPGLETRHYMQAWMFMRYFLKVQPAPDTAKRVYCVMVEVATSTGVMGVVGYADYSARSFHSSGGGVTWEKPNDSLNGQIDAMLKAGENAVNAIPLVLVDVLPNPPKQADHILINIATPSGLYHGLGTGDFISNDPYAGPILNAATDLLGALESLKK